MEIVKITKSISPLTNREIDARVIREGECIYLTKVDEEGKEYRGLIEKDPEIYRLLSRHRLPCQVPYDSIFLYLTRRCNLNCPICYESVDSDGEDMKVDEIQSLLSGHKGRVIVLGGREPTCHDNIFDIISVANRRNHTRLLTNGIKLADEGYVKALKRARLEGVIFSFNGFDDKIYKKMNGKPLLDLKLKALENIRRLGIRTTLSVTLARGINDDQVQGLYNFCIKNRSFINYLRFRTMTYVGRHIDVEPFTLSEMFDLLTSSLGISREEVIKEVIMLDIFGKSWGFDRPRLRVCGFDFHVERMNDGPASMGGRIGEGWPRLIAKRIISPFILLRIYGLRYLLEEMSLIKRFPFLIRDHRYLRIGIRSWPDLYNIDLEEMRKCPTGYYKRGRIYPFCYHNIIDTNPPAVKS